MGNAFRHTLLTIALTVVPMAAHAQATEDSLLTECFNLRTAGRHQESLPRCEQAVALTHSSRALGQLALTEIALQRYVDAAQHLAVVLADTVHPWVQRNRATLDEAVRTARPHVAELHVSADVTGAALRVEGRDLGVITADGVWYLAPGSAAVTVRATDGREVTRVVALAAGGSVHERFTFAPGAAIATTPAGGRPAEAPPPDVSTRRVLAWVAAGGAVLGFGLALTSWRIREGVVSDFTARCPDGATTNLALVDRCKADRADAENTLGTWDAVSTAGLVAGGVLAAASVVLFVTRPTSSAPRTAVSCGGLGTLGVRCAVSF